MSKGAGRRAASCRRDSPKPAFAVSSEGETRPNVFQRQVGKVVNHLGRRQPNGQVSRQVAHRHSQPANARPNAPLVWLDLDDAPAVHYSPPLPPSIGRQLCTCGGCLNSRPRFSNPQLRAKAEKTGHSRATMFENRALLYDNGDNCHEALDIDSPTAKLRSLTPGLIFVVDSRQCAARFAHTAVPIIGRELASARY